MAVQRWSDVAKWDQFSLLPTSKSVNYNKLRSPKEALDYEFLEVSLLVRYNFTERCRYRK